MFQGHATVYDTLFQIMTLTLIFNTGITTMLENYSLSLYADFFYLIFE